MLGSVLIAAAPAKAADDLASMLEPIRQKYGLPAIAAAAMQKATLLGSGAIGVRKDGSKDPVTLEDQWHIGSCTKSMTSTLAAVMVERGEMKWTATVGESFPDFRDVMDEKWLPVTLEQLLQNRGGAPTDPPENVWRNASRHRGTPTEQRADFVRALLMRRPEAEPGAKFIYSNQGYAIAGTMLERAAGRPWEDLLRQWVFAAALMPGAGFGAPASLGKVDQPWGHFWKKDRWLSIPPGPDADNPAAIGPAGTVHCSIEELARYAVWHARGERGGIPSLKKESFLKLHTPPAGGDYAMGWTVTTRPWAGGTALTHNGSNTMFYAVMWLAPARDAAFVAATNCMSEGAMQACDAAAAAMIGKYLP